MADAVDSASVREREDLLIALLACHLGEALRRGLSPASHVDHQDGTGPRVLVLPDVAIKLIQLRIDSTPTDTLQGTATRLGLAAMLEGRFPDELAGKAAGPLVQLAVDALRLIEADGGQVELSVVGRFTHPGQWPSDFNRESRGVVLI